MALLEIADITVRFGGLTAVDGVQLTAEAGRITGLIGPNGAGKTTLFNVITGLQRATAGSVRLDGVDVTGEPPYKRARRGMARTFQRLELFGALTVRENIQVAASIAARWDKSLPSSQQTVQDLAHRVGLSKVLDVRADALPTGQGRLVELARALAIRPRLLLLDEPASGQDEDETEHFATVLQELTGEGLGILLVEHDMQLVMGVCDFIYVLDFGRLLAADEPARIRENDDVLAAYLGREWEPA